MSKINIALIGAGVWGEQHARIFSIHPEVNFCAIVGRTEKKTRVRAAKYNVPYYFDIQDMLDNEHPDLVSLCLPNQGHFEPTLQVIKAGFALFVEKPLAFDLQEADMLLQEAEKKGLFFAINLNHRYAKPVEMAHEAIQNGRVGAINFATWRFGGEGPNSPVHENLIETQCHGFDMLEFLCGPIDSITAQMVKTDERQHSTMAMALHFSNGAVGSMTGSYDSSYAYPDTHMVEVNGNKGRLFIEDTVKKYTFNQAGAETAEVWQAGYFNDVDREFHRTFDKHFEALIGNFRAEKEPPIHARAGRRALELAHAAVRSYEESRFIQVPAVT